MKYLAIKTLTYLFDTSVLIFCLLEKEYVIIKLILIFININILLVFININILLDNYNVYFFYILFDITSFLFFKQFLLMKFCDRFSIYA